MLQRHLHADRERRGGVILLALIVAMVVGAMAMGFMQLNASATRRQEMAVDNKLAFYVAEAGLSESFVSILGGKSGDIGTSAVPARFGDGLVWVEATVMDENHRRLDSTGMSGRGLAKLSIIVEQGFVHPAQFGIFTNQDLVIPEGTFIDGYDSTAVVPAGESGGYAGPSVQGKGNVNGAGGGNTTTTIDPVFTVGTEPPVILAPIGSNGNIRVSSSTGAPTTIGGTLATGPQGSVELIGSPTIQGDVNPLGATLTFPGNAFPDVVQDQSLVHSNGTPLLLDPGTHGYTSVSVGADSSMILTGPVSLVVDTFELASGSSLVVDDRAGDVRVYARESVNFAAGSSFSQLEGSTEKFQLRIDGTGTSTLASTGALHGFVYSPNGQLALSPDLEMFGSIVADSLAIASGVSMHFDDALAKLAAAASLPKLISWRILELGESRTGRSADAFTALGVDRGALAPLAASTEQPTMYMEYQNVGGGPWVVYNGAWDAFTDWMNVGQLRWVEKDGVVLDNQESAALLESMKLLRTTTEEAAADVAAKVPLETVDSGDLTTAP